MKRLLLIALLLVGFNSYSYADNSWTTTDVTLQTVVTALTIIDCAQTLHIARNPEKHYEDGFAKNFIGSHPSAGRVTSYFISSIAFKTAVAVILPSPYRTFWQISLIGISNSYIQRNRDIGIGVSFHF